MSDLGFDTFFRLGDLRLYAAMQERPFLATVLGALLNQNPSKEQLNATIKGGEEQARLDAAEADLQNRTSEAELE